MRYYGDNKIINNMASLFLMAVSVLFVTGCGNKDKLPQGVDDYTKKMEAVTKEIKETKKHDKALLLVSFGSTHDEPRATFSAMKKQFAGKFRDMDVYFSFTSEICIARCASKGLDYYSPSFYLNAIGNAGYKEVGVQSLHVIPGEEYLRVKNVIKDFHNKGDQPEFADITVYLGGPLLYDSEDVGLIARKLHHIYAGEVEKGKAVVFMGHGNPEDTNYANGNSRYTMLEEALQKINPGYYVATVDMNGNLVTDMIERMKHDGIKKGTDVICHPLMSTAGDHAKNDMLGGSETEAGEGSWRHELTKAGFSCPKENCHVKGLGDYPEIVDIWISHMETAFSHEPLFKAE